VEPLLGDAMPADGARHFLHCDEPLPCPAGTSPFRIKGEFWRQMALVVGHNDARTNGGVTRVLEREGIAEYAAQPFLASSLYDVLPMPRVVMAVAEARSRDLRELTRKMGRASAESQMSGVYGNLLRAVTLDNFAARFGPTITYFYDFAPLTGEDLPGGGVRLFRDGVPLCVAEWWGIVTGEFVDVVLTGHGASRVKVDWRIAPTDVERGVPCGTVTGDVRWTA
jgi:hypothetical protein